MLVGLLVAAPAVGGAVAALAANADGPMSLSFPFAAPALLLLLSGYGLRRGRRLAWWLAIVSNVTLLAAAFRFAYGTGSRLGGHVTSLQAGGRATALSREAMVLPVVTLTVLLVTRRRFDQVADREAAGKLAAIVAAAFGASLAAFLLLGYPSGPGGAAGGRRGAAGDLGVVPARPAVRQPGHQARPGRETALRLGLRAVLDRRARRAGRVVPAHLRLPGNRRGGPGPRHPHGPIAIAIGRAYLPNLTSRQALRLLAKLRWPPAAAVPGGSRSQADAAVRT